MGQTILIIVVAFLVLTTVMLVCREVWCWYWKINQAVKLLVRIEANTRCLYELHEHERQARFHGVNRKGQTG